MAGSVGIGGGKMQVIGTDGLKRFDTDDGLFHVINTFSGSINVPSLVFSDGTNYNLTTDWTIGACHAECTDVLGSIKFTLASYAAGMAYNRWHSMMGGCAVWLQDGHSLTGSSPDRNGRCYQHVMYYFVIESAVVKLRRRALNNKTSQGTYVVSSHTISYKLKAGLFT